jgi:hypothetical protein
VAKKSARTRFDRLHRPALVRLAERVAALALDEEQASGKAILYMTKWDIAKKLGVSSQMVGLAMRLSYTAEFAQAYGYSFIAPGSGRSGEIHGYVLEHGTARTTDEARDNLSDNDMKLHDHLNGSAQHWRMVAVGNGGKTTPTGKLANRIAKILTGAAASVEDALDKQGL